MILKRISEALSNNRGGFTPMFAPILTGIALSFVILFKYVLS